MCLASVQARLCQCLWLLSESRINHCWTLFGTVARLTYAIGLHRKRSADYIDHIELECRRRTFWSAYALDNYLSAALGRPLTFHDEDIDQELPSCIDDSGIYVDHIVKDDSHGQSVMLGPVAYAKYDMWKGSSSELRRLTTMQTFSDLKHDSSKCLFDQAVTPEFKTCFCDSIYRGAEELAGRRL